jgi:hypothetical protein
MLHRSNAVLVQVFAQFRDVYDVCSLVLLDHDAHKVSSSVYSCTVVYENTRTWSYRRVNIAVMKECLYSANWLCVYYDQTAT